MDNTVKKMKKKKMKSEALAVHVDRRLLGEDKARAPEVLAVRGRGAPSRRLLGEDKARAPRRHSWGARAPTAQT